MRLLRLVLAIVVALVLIYVRYHRNLIGSVSAQPLVMRSSDGRLEITIPARWSAAPEIQSTAAKIKVRSADKHAYAMVLSEEKMNFADGLDIAGYTKLTEEHSAAKSKLED